MVQIEKAVKGLECCLPMMSKYAIGNCLECPYARKITPEEGPTGCCHEMLYDALELLKGQEPRVMTLEELLPATKDDVWLEYDNAVTPATWVMTDTKEKTISYYCHGFIHHGRGVTMTLPIGKYGVDWRCWTSRPDDKRRAETPWEKINCSKIRCPRQAGTVPDDCSIENCPWRTEPPADILAEKLKRCKTDNMSPEFIHGFETAMREINGKYIPIELIPKEWIVAMDDMRPMKEVRYWHRFKK